MTAPTTTATSRTCARETWAARTANATIRSAASAMMPVSRRTIRSAIERCSVGAAACRSRRPREAPAEPRPTRMPSANRFTTSGATRTCSGSRPPPRGRDQQQRSKQRPARSPTPAPPAAGTRTDTDGRRAIQAPAPQSPATRFGDHHRPRRPTRWTSATRFRPVNENAQWRARLRRKALCNTLLQEWCITPSARVSPTANEEPEASVLKSYLPVLVFLGLGVAVGARVHDAQPDDSVPGARTRPSRRRTSAACLRTCSAASASGSAST